MGIAGSNHEVQVGSEVWIEAAEAQLVAATGSPRSQFLRNLMKDCGDAEGEDFYSMFGLKRYCDITEMVKGRLNQRFKELMLRWHPDRNPGPREVKKRCHVQTVKITLAKNVLEHKDLKRRYDLELRRQWKETDEWSTTEWYLKWGYSVVSMMGGLGLIIASAAGVVASGGTSLAVSSAGSSLLVSGMQGATLMWRDPDSGTAEFVKDAGVGALRGGIGSAVTAGGACAIAATAGTAAKVTIGVATGAASTVAGQCVSDAADVFFERIVRLAPDVQHLLVTDANDADFMLSRTNLQKEFADHTAVALLREGFSLCADNSLASGWGGPNWVEHYVRDAQKTRFGVLVLEGGEGFFQSKPCCDELYAAKAVGLNLTKVHGNSIRKGQYLWVQITDKLFPTDKDYEVEMRAEHGDQFTPYHHTVEMGAYYNGKVEGKKYTYYCIVPRGRAAVATGADRQYFCVSSVL